MPGKTRWGAHKPRHVHASATPPPPPLNPFLVLLNALVLVRGAGKGEGGVEHTHTLHNRLLPLQETHYSGTPHTAGPATDVRALLSTTLGALCTEEVRKGDCPLGAPCRTAQARNGRTRFTGRVTSGDNTRTDNKVARTVALSTAGTGGRSAAEDRRRKPRLRYRDRMEDGAR